MASHFPQQFGTYQLEELIARGGMAEVYRATVRGANNFSRTVAIKKILPHLVENDGFITMLIDEAQLVVGLNHANIAQVYDLGKIEDTYYVAMEYVHGIDVSTMIKTLQKRDEIVPFEHITYIISCMCMGLHIAHHALDGNGQPLNIVHRDVSPHNVLVSFSGDVKVIDFGVAKADRRSGDETQMGILKGKLLYMAPEQAKTEALDGRADLFAAGLVMYKMLTRSLPFEGENEFQVYNNILKKEIVPPKLLNPQVPEELNQICMTLLQRDPDRRYQDGRTAKQALDRALHHIAPGYTPARLGRFVEDNFSAQFLQKQADARAAQKANAAPKPQPTPVAPASPNLPAQPSGGYVQVNERPNPVHTTNPRHESGNNLPVAGHTPANGWPSDTNQFDQQQVTAPPLATTPPQKESKGVPFALIAVILMTLIFSGLIAYAVLESDKAEPALKPTPQFETTKVDPKPTPAPKTPEEPKAPAPTTLTVAVDSEPSGALVFLGEKQLGTTPFKDDAILATTLPMTLRLEKEGHLSAQLEVTSTSLAPEPVILEPAPKKAALEKKDNSAKPQSRKDNAPKPKDSSKENKDSTQNRDAKKIELFKEQKEASKPTPEPKDPEPETSPDNSEEFIDIFESPAKKEPTKKSEKPKKDPAPAKKKTPPKEEDGWDDL